MEKGTWLCFRPEFVAMCPNTGQIGPKSGPNDAFSGCNGRRSGPNFRPKGTFGVLARDSAARGTFSVFSTHLPEIVDRYDPWRGLDPGGVRLEGS